MGNQRSMKQWLLRKQFLSLMTLLCLSSMLIIVLWFRLEYNHKRPHIPTIQKMSVPKTFNHCEGCKMVIGEMLQSYSLDWQKQEGNYQKFRSKLKDKCQGFNEAIITQKNTPVGSNLVYSWHKKTIQVTPELFSTFAKENPFSNQTWDTCAVIGNGGILSNSGCGEMIDSAQFVIRYGSLTERRRAFVESLRPYGNALLLLPTFALDHDTAACQRAIYTIEDFESPMRPISFNPKYLKNLSNFWRNQGLGSRRMSSGIIMASLALEVCENVHLYGFWPFSSHPVELYDLTHHYYDNETAKNKVHTMPSEFKFLLELHSQGILNIHLQNCHHKENIDPCTAGRTKVPSL